MEREYTVIANTREDLPALETEITASSGAGPIPNRSVGIANPRPGSKIQTHFMLTDEEAEALRSDPRVRAVEIPLDDRDDVTIELNATQTGSFFRGESGTANDVNWGLRRCIKDANDWPSGSSPGEAIDNVYDYAIDGTGVDVVITDSGIDPDHPEWLNPRDELIENLSGTNDFITNTVTDLPNSRVVHTLDQQYRLTGTKWYDLADTTVQLDPQGTWQHNKEFRIEFFEANGTKITEVTRTYRHDIFAPGTGLTETQFSKSYSGDIYIGESIGLALQTAIFGKSGTVKISFAQGQSRVHQIDWYSVSNLSGTQSADHYRDLDGHGTHVAGTVAGLTHGWAKGAHIYALKVAGLETLTGSDGTGISTTDLFDCIRLWHNNKANGRPTVVNASWGAGTNVTGDPDSGTYRGTPWTWGVNYNNDFTLWGDTGVVPPTSGTTRRLPTQITSIDAEVEDMINDGVHMCIAAGNDYYKADVPSGDDYDNSVTFGATTRFYHRPGSPYASGAFNVGNINTAVDTTFSRDRARGSSKKGPGVNIWAPGGSIMAATSTQRDSQYDSASYDYPLNNAFEIMSISGTSMASPQVCGVIAQHLQVNPEMDPATMKNRIIQDSKAQCFDIEGTVDFDYVATEVLKIVNTDYTGSLFGFLSQTDDLGYLFADANNTGGPLSLITSSDATLFLDYGVNGTSGDSAVDTWIEDKFIPAAQLRRFQYPGLVISDTTSYSDTDSLLGSPNRMLFSKYGKQPVSTNAGTLVRYIRSTK